MQQWIILQHSLPQDAHVQLNVRKSAQVMLIMAWR